jgi:Protein of unknown function (DUF992)
MSRMPNLKRALGAFVALAATAPFAAYAGDRVGALECHVSGNGISILVENQALDCIYKDDDPGLPPSHYVGRLTKVGANLSVNGPGQLLWVVAAATRQIGPGALAGDYAGPEATVKAGVGGGGAVLVGGSNNTISLQPLTVEAGTGLGVTAGIESLSLAYVPPPPPPPPPPPVKHRRHHHHH